MRKFCLLFILFILPFYQTFTQFDNLAFNLQLFTGYTSSGYVPFWLRSNKYGSVPVDGASAGLVGLARRDYKPDKTGIFDWGASLEGRLNVGHTTQFRLIEGYGKVRAGVFELRAGRSKEIMGLCDTSLSAGAWAVSGTALGIPKVQLGIPEFYTIPFLGKMFAFKGQFAHGWLGYVTLNRPGGVELEEDTIQNKTYFHQKSFYGRFGKASWPFKLYGGFSHQVFWGNEDIYYGDLFTLSPAETFYYVVAGKPYINLDIPTSSKIGNHLGSIDLGAEFQVGKIKFLLYRQNFYDVGNLYYLANIRDGLNGISIENQNKSDHLFTWKKFLFEFLYTKSQAGEPTSPDTPTPCEHYYNNGQYMEGWSYNGISLGTPFITPRDLVRDELVAHSRDNFTSNNRVIAFHVGFEGSIEKWHYRIKTSWSKNFGTYRTTDEEQNAGITNPGNQGIFGEHHQLSACLEGYRSFSKGYSIGFLTAFDSGEVLYDSFGLLLMASKSF